MTETIIREINDRNFITIGGSFGKRVTFIPQERESGRVGEGVSGRKACRLHLVFYLH